MPEIKTREYYCPLCDSIEAHKTNHIREIYCNCKTCGHGVLYCSENKINLKEIKKAFIVPYYFDLTDKIQASMYKTLEKELKTIGYKKFSSLNLKYREVQELEKINRHLYISIYEDLNGQYATNLGRLHNWLEWYFENKQIKQGYYMRFD